MKIYTQRVRGHQLLSQINARAGENKQLALSLTVFVYCCSLQILVILTRPEFREMDCLD